jgi:hypothetical protein
VEPMADFPHSGEAIAEIPLRDGLTINCPPGTVLMQCYFLRSISGKFYCAVSETKSNPTDYSISFIRGVKSNFNEIDVSISLKLLLFNRSILFTTRIIIPH